MKTAEQIAEKLWEKYAHKSVAYDHTAMFHHSFLEALREYGEAVRQRAAGVCEKMSPAADRFDCADAIERMELP